MTRLILFKLIIFCFFFGSIACVSKVNLNESESKKNTKSVYDVTHGDILKIQVQGESECSGEFVVNPEGNILFCYLGVIEVKGKSSIKIKQNLEKLLKEDYLINPIVDVQVKGGNWTQNSIRIIGEINSPGIYSYKSGYTVLDAILDAGGFTEFASPNRTRIVRGEGDFQQVMVVKMKEIMKTGDRAKDTLLRPGDTIVVPEGIL